jgi:hypothetical protein
MPAKSPKGFEMKGLDGSNPPLSTSQCGFRSTLRDAKPYCPGTSLGPDQRGLRPPTVSRCVLCKSVAYGAILKQAHCVKLLGELNFERRTRYWRDGRFRPHPS